MKPEVLPEKALARGKEFPAFRRFPPGHFRWRLLRSEDLTRPSREEGLRAKQLVTNWIISYYAPKDP